LGATAISPAIVRGFLRLALATEAGIDSVLGELLALAETCARHHHVNEARSVLHAAGELLGDNNVNVGGATPASRALLVGRMAERLRFPDLARTVYMRGREQLDPNLYRHSIGVLSHDIGNTWSTEGNGSEAIAAYRAAADAVTDLSGRVTTLASLGAAEARWGAPERAKASFERAVEVLAAEAKAAHTNIEVIVSASLGLGRKALSARMPALARAAYQTAIELVDPATHPDAVALLWNDMGDAWTREREGAKALDAYRTAVRLGNDETRVVALTSLAHAESTWGSGDAAKQALVRATEILEAMVGRDGSDRQALASLAGLIARSGEALGCHDISERARQRVRVTEPPKAPNDSRQDGTGALA
jgi:tetratricopeptide (TPR) repeat protein